MTKFAVLTFVVFAFFYTPTEAGIYSDSMGKCLVSATSDEDKAALVRWMFANVTLHPAVASLSAISVEQRDNINKTAGQMFERLLTDSCKKETAEALQYEGPVAIQLSFQILGQVASSSMLTDPAVGQGFAQLGKYIDQKKIAELTKKN